MNKLDFEKQEAKKLLPKYKSWLKGEIDIYALMLAVHASYDAIPNFFGSKQKAINAFSFLKQSAVQQNQFFLFDSLQKFKVAFLGNELDIEAKALLDINAFTSSQIDKHEQIKFTEDTFPYLTERQLSQSVDEPEAVLPVPIFKTWVTQRDSKVRGSHKDVDGTKILVSGKFQVGGSMLLYPADYGNYSLIKDVINCRCYLKYGVI